MELDQVMRSTFAARQYKDEKIPDATLYRILDNARFAQAAETARAGALLW